MIRFFLIMLQGPLSSFQSLDELKAWCEKTHQATSNLDWQRNVLFHEVTQNTALDSLIRFQRNALCPLRTFVVCCWKRNGITQAIVLLGFVTCYDLMRSSSSNFAIFVSDLKRHVHGVIVELQERDTLGETSEHYQDWHWPWMQSTSSIPQEEDLKYETFMECAGMIVRREPLPGILGYNRFAHTLLAYVGCVMETEAERIAWNVRRMKAETERIVHLASEYVKNEADAYRLLCYNDCLPSYASRSDLMSFCARYPQETTCPLLYFEVSALELSDTNGFVGDIGPYVSATWKDLVPQWICNRLAIHSVQVTLESPFLRAYAIKDWLMQAYKLWKQAVPLVTITTTTTAALSSSSGIRFQNLDQMIALFPPCILDKHNECVKTKRFPKHTERIHMISYMFNAGFSSEEMAFYFDHMNARFPNGKQQKRTERFPMKSWIQAQQKKPNPLYCSNIWNWNGTKYYIRCPHYVPDIEDAQNVCKTKCCGDTNMNGPHNLTRRRLMIKN